MIHQIFWDIGKSRWEFVGSGPRNIIGDFIFAPRAWPNNPFRSIQSSLKTILSWTWTRTSILFITSGISPYHCLRSFLYDKLMFWLIGTWTRIIRYFVDSIGVRTYHDCIRAFFIWFDLIGSWSWRITDFVIQFFFSIPEVYGRHRSHLRGWRLSFQLVGAWTRKGIIINFKWSTCSSYSMKCLLWIYL